VEFCGDGANVGIPKALNHAWRHAEGHGYTHLLTMDQDSCWEDFEGYLSKVRSPDAPRNAYFGANSFGWDRTCGFVPYKEIITSGMLVPIEVVAAVGGWREDFFVDAVDTEFNFHAVSLGYTPYLVGSAILLQRFGAPHYARFLWKKIRCPGYSPARLRGIYRNHVIVIRSYPELSADLRKSLPRSALSRAFRILVGERQKLQKILAIINGFRDGLRYRLP